MAVALSSFDKLRGVDGERIGVREGNTWSANTAGTTQGLAVLDSLN